MGEIYLFSDSCLPSMLDAKRVMAVSCNFPTRDKRFATFNNDFNLVYKEKLIQVCYFLISSVSDLPITAIFQEHHVYTVEKSMVAVVFRFLVSPKVFFLSIFSFSFLILISAQLFYIISRLIFPDLVTFPVIYYNFHFLLGAFSFLSSKIQHSVQLLYFKFPGMLFILSKPQKAEQCGRFKFFSNRNNQAMGGV